METKHTPGPWNTDEQVIFASSGEAVASTWKFGQFDTGGRGSHAEAEANARLIAAAPDMLDALHQWAAAERMEDAEELENARKSRDAAIAKAEG